MEDISESKENNFVINCFICNNCLDCDPKYSLLLCKVNHSESQVTELLGRLVQDDWIVYVSNNDFLCHRCMILLNQMDELEFNLKKVKNKLTQFLKNSYNLTNSDDGMTANEVNGLEQATVGIQNNILNKHIKNKTQHVEGTYTKSDIDKEDLATNEDQNIVFKCDVCFLSIIGYTTFAKHIKQRHGLTEQHIQNVKTFEKVVKPKTHRKNEIKNFEKIVQKHTLQESKNNLNVNEPSNDDNENNLIFCDACGIHILEKDSEIHVCDHDMSIYICSSCDETFRDELSYNNHQKVCDLLTEPKRSDHLLILNCDINNDKYVHTHAEYGKSDFLCKVPVLENDTAIKNEIVVLESGEVIEDTGIGHNRTATIIDGNTILTTNSLVRDCLNTNSNIDTTSTTILEQSLKEEESSENIKPELCTEPAAACIYKCGVCDFQDPSMLVVKSHVDNHEEHQTPFKCEYCQLNCCKKTVLDLHILRRHKNVHSGNCLFCQKIFLDKNHLNVHLEKDHSEVKVSPFCPYCDKMHTTEADLKSHILRHHFNFDPQFSGESLKSNSYIPNGTENQSVEDSTFSENNSFDKVFSSIDQDTDQKDECASYEPEDRNNQSSKIPDICCAICDFTTKELTEMKNHIVCHQTKENNFCKICYQFFCSKEFNKHLHHAQEFQTLQCKYCNEQLHDSIHLKYHTKKVHFDINLNNCKVCSKVYTDKYTLMKHMKTKHVVEKPLKSCDSCSTSFKSDRHYKNHIEYAHRTTLKCKMCGKELQSWKKLQYHEKAHLKHATANYKCNVCNKVLKTQTGLRFHTMRHTGNFPYYCEFCGQGFVSIHALTEHIGHHIKETRYTCDVCGKGFYYYDTMYRHRILHDNPYPKTCNICKKSFRNSSRLAIHRRREHTGERPYKCTYCPQSFFTSNGYKHHLCQHTKIFPYNCEPCNKGFTTRHKYAIHLSRKHNDHSMLVNRAPNNKEWNEQWFK